MRFTGRLFVLCQADDLLDLGRRDPRFTATPFTHLAELGQPLISEPAPPRADRDRGNPNRRSDLGVSHTVGGHQQTVARLTSRCAAVEDLASTVNASR